MIFTNEIRPFLIPLEHKATITTTKSEKENFEALNPHFSFECKTKQKCGFTVNENKSIQLFNFSCRSDETQQN